MEWRELITYLRLLAYAALALLMGLVIPVYHASFRMTWRTAGLFFAVGGVAVVMRLYAPAEVYQWWTDYALTPMTLVLAVVTLVNLGTVSAFYGPRRKDK